MSEHSKILEKYEKMFQDGSAYHPIVLNQQMPSMSEAMGGGDRRSEIPLGEQQVVDNDLDNGHDPHANYSEFDAHMAARVNALKEGKKFNPSNEQNQDYQKLERRISLLEKALELVMETQTKLIKES